MVTNLILVGFNLTPTFPMDSGQALRFLLAMRLKYTSATNLAASIGQRFAFLFGFIGLFTNPFLVFSAISVGIGAANELRMVQMKSALRGIPVSWKKL